MKKIAVIFITLKWYQEKWCETHNGQIEFTLQDGTLCDCMSNTHAIEFHSGDTWFAKIFALNLR